jgi:hypothetical protein
MMDEALNAQQKLYFGTLAACCRGCACQLKPSCRVTLQRMCNLTGDVLLLQVQDPVEGRRMMDEALDFWGNLYFGAVAACCVGCACWQRCFNLLQRWALILVCMSLVGTYTPWAFGQSLANLDSFGGE